MQFPDSPRFHVMEAGGKLSRPIYVYLPEAAEKNPRKKFPVLYCQDGQNLWDDPHCCFGHGGWYLNRIVDELTDDNRIEPLILVGIPNSDERYRDYSPGKSFADISAHAYANFLCAVVKPRVEKYFPARRQHKDVGLLGSSLGGLVSLWIAHQKTEIFGKVACLSGAFQVRDRQKKSFADFLRAHGRCRLRVYLDSGTVDDGVSLTRKVCDVYRELGWRDGKDLMYYRDEGGEHNEKFWRDRVWRALTFLYSKSS